jgi:diguanylate cyclase (GGDEF)-like protein
VNDIACINTGIIIAYLKRLHRDLSPLLADFPFDEAYLSDPNHWITLTEYLSLLNQVKEFLGVHDPRVFYKIALEAPRLRSLGLFERFGKVLGRTGKVMAGVPQYHRRFNHLFQVRLQSLEKTSSILSIHFREEFAGQWIYDLCPWNEGMLASIPRLFGLPAAESREECCFFTMEEVLSKAYGYLNLPVSREGEFLFVGEEAVGKRVPLPEMGAGPLEFENHRRFGYLATRDLLIGNTIVLKAGTLYGASSCRFHLSWQHQSFWQNLYDFSWGQVRERWQAANLLEDQLDYTEKQFQEIQGLHLELNCRYEESERLRREAETGREELKKLYERTKELADRDPLTGLLNYRRVQEMLEYEMERAKRNHHPFSVMMIDLDAFKIFNDTYGHVMGDGLLKYMSDTFRRCCRTIDHIARYGGDEFMIVMPDTDGDKARGLAERILERLQVEGFAVSEGERVPVRLSFGISTYPIDSGVKEDLVTLADQALYRSKAQPGKNTVFQNSTFSFEQGDYQALDELVEKADRKDLYTRRHTDLVVKYVEKMGRVLALAREDQEMLVLGARLHDIGKISIPDAILKKPGLLTAEEKDVIRQHTIFGQMIASQFPQVPPEAVEMILYHHESYNGLGYPRGLKGPHIPRLARILTLVDAYAAMTSKHLYREALSQPEALVELEKYAGIQFDPVLVPVFIEMVRTSRLSDRLPE